MAVVWLQLLLLGLVFSPAVRSASSAEDLGVRLTVSNLGLDYLVSTATPLLSSFVADNVSVPDIDCHASKSFGPITTVIEVSAHNPAERGNGALQARLSEITCSKVSIPSNEVELAATVNNTLELKTGDITIKYSAKWCYLLSAADSLTDYSSSNGCSAGTRAVSSRTKSNTRRRRACEDSHTADGTVDITVKKNSKEDHSFDLLVGLTAPDSANTSLSLSKISSNLAVTDLSFSGGGTAILLDLIKPYIESEVQDYLNSEIDSEVTKYIEKASSLLLDPPYNALACAVNSTPTNLYCDSNIVGIKRDSRIGPLVPLPEPPAEQMADRHAALLLDFEGLNGLLDIVWGMAFADQFLTQDVVSSALIPLNTSTFWPDVMPELRSNYDAMPMRVHLNATSRVFLSASDDAVPALRLNVPLTLTFTVDDPENGFVDLFVSSCKLTMDLVPAIVSNDTTSVQVVTANISQYSCPLVINRSATIGGPVSLTALQARIDALLTLGTAYANSHFLNDGFEIPSIDVSIGGMKGALSFANSVLSLMQTGATPFIGFFTNISYSATAVGETRSMAEVAALVGSALSSLRRVVSSNSSSGPTSNNPAAKRATRNTKRAPPAWVHASQLSRAIPSGNELSIVSFGAVAGSWTHRVTNALALTWAFGNASSGDTVVVPGGGGDFYMVGGINATQLDRVTMRVDGVIRAAADYVNWPKSTKNKFLDFLTIDSCTGFTMTAPESSWDGTSGLFDGQGQQWWSDALLTAEAGGKAFPSGSSTDRPRLIIFNQCNDTLMENVFVMNSPRFNVHLFDMLNLEVRNVKVLVDKAVTRPDNNSLASRQLLYDPIQPLDANTDGIDPSGVNIWIHNVFVQNDDDSIAVKPCNPDKCTNAGGYTGNVLIEDSTLIGAGASIGSVTPQTSHAAVINVTWRNISMPHTLKGIYLKSDPGCMADGSKTGEITDILYEDIDIFEPLWWAIFIGPQQQQEFGTSVGDKCSLFYKLIPNQQCETSGCVTFNNITLRRVTITNPAIAPGMLLGNNTIKSFNNITFDTVVVTNPGTYPFDMKSTYLCTHTDNSISSTASSPEPCA